MSRRKQSKPRHLGQDEEDTEHKTDNLEDKSDLLADNEDAHVCGKCRQEFIDLSEFLEHRKTCRHQRIVEAFDEDSETEDGNEGCNVPSTEDDVFNPETVHNETQNVHSDGVPSSPLGQDEDYNRECDMTDTDRSHDNEHTDDITYRSMSHHNEHNDDITDSVDGNDNDDSMDGSIDKYLDENQNMQMNDVAFLQSTLYSLQQQQLFQLTLIQQLQAQLIGSGVTPTGLLAVPPSGSGLFNPLQTLLTSLSTGGSTSVPPNMPVPAFPSDSSSVFPPTTVANNTSSITNTPSSSTVSDVTPQLEVTTPTSPVELCTSSSDVKPSNADLSPFEILKRQADKLISKQHNENTERKVASTNVMSSGLTRPQYCSEDPFFKHKCRFCSKIFGSDSGLQIHVRSHTGERPFKCNICGNRFSTKGNLKVHFSRHRARYPYVKMNPHPVPEHLDSTATTPRYMVASPSISKDTESSNREQQDHSVGVPLPTSVPGVKSPKSQHKLPGESSSSPVTSEIQRKSSPTESVNIAPEQVSPKADDTANMAGQQSTTTVTSCVTSPLTTPLPSYYPGMSLNAFFPNPVLPSSSIDPAESMEEFMEISKSETSKLEALVKNIETKLTDPNQCVICHRVLSCKSALQMHYRIHTGERPFKCKICGRSFTTKGNLKTHMGVHRSKPPLRIMHQCPVCHKQFTNSMVLQQHIRMHTQMRLASRSLSDPGSSMFLSKNPKPISGEGTLLSPSMMQGDTTLLSPTVIQEAGKEDHKRSSSEGHSPVPTLPAPEHNMKDNKDTNISPASTVDWPVTKDNQNGDNVDIMSPGTSDDSRKPESPRINTDKEVNPVSTAEQRYMLNPLPPVFGHTDDHHPGMSGFSTSLAALEEKVNAMETKSQENTPKNPKKEMLMRHSVGEVDRIITDPKKQISPSEATVDWVHRNGNTPQDHTDTQHIRENGYEDSENETGVNSSMTHNENETGVNMTHQTLEFPGGMYDNKTSTTCDICLKTFACLSALDIHYRSHTKEKPFVCQVCDRTFTTRGNMKQHMLTHKIRDLPSDFSTQEEESNMSDTSSITDDPPKLVIATAPVKNEPIQESSSLKRPSTSEPESPIVKFAREQPRALAKHQCSVCLKHFSSASALQIHFRTHTGDKPFKCTVCGKAFTTKGNLKVHMGTHMWTSSPSRRGRRMSVENPIPTMPNGDTGEQQLKSTNFPQRSPHEMYYPFAPFLGSFMPKFNDIAMMQNLSAYPYLPINSAEMYLNGNYLPPGASEAMMKAYFPGNPLNLVNGTSNNNKGDMPSEKLMSPTSSSPPSSPSISDTSDRSHDDSYAANESRSSRNNYHESPNPLWLWRTTCHLCNKSCESVEALHSHLQSHLPANTEDTQKPLLA
nr:Sall [Terebratalia transversa]